MYTENPGRDALRFTRAVLTNQVARFTPGLYFRLTRQTGRGAGVEDPAQIAGYFVRCFDEYMARLEVPPGRAEAFLSGKTVLEYGPGDVLGVALLMYAHGAASVRCVDRFPLERASATNLAVYRSLLERLEPAQRERGSAAFNRHGEPASAFRPDAIRYDVTRDGLAGAREAYDLVVSRAVLEHVDRLEQTIADIAGAMRRDAVAIHKVDLKSHGMDRYHPFDFLTWPEPAYRLMNSHKGNPNRWRVDKYRDLVSRHGLRFRALSDTGRLAPEQIERIRSSLASRFRGIPTDDLAWLGFWMVLEHAPAGAPARN
ncbi:methyltransferase domain-containing protein [Luteimonas pelagia]